MSYESWGPLAGLIGTWESGYDGLDVSFHNDKGKIGETPYREKTTFKPFGPVLSGDQSLHGLDYRTAAYREGEDLPFHTEVGYWMWDAANQQVTRNFVMARAQALIAGNTVAPDATTFTLESVIGSNTYGILSNKHLDEVAHTTRFDVTVSLTGDTYSYDETTVVEHQRQRSIIMHTDRNTLKLVSREE
jgi:hypothetical protein